jgi:hypothetical protein
MKRILARGDWAKSDAELLKKLWTDRRGAFGPWPELLTLTFSALLAILLETASIQVLAVTASLPCSRLIFELPVSLE